MPQTMKCAEQDDRRFHIDTEQARDYPRTLESSTGSRRHACNFELWISPGNLAPHQLTAVGPFTAEARRPHNGPMVRPHRGTLKDS